MTATREEAQAQVDAELASRRGRVHWRPGVLTKDHCEVCGVQLYEDERVEITGTFTVRDRDAAMGGLGGITATYCTEHAPEAP